MLAKERFMSGGPRRSTIRTHIQPHVPSPTERNRGSSFPVARLSEALSLTHPTIFISKISQDEASLPFTDLRVARQHLPSH